MVKPANACDYLLVTCMDYRIQTFIEAWAAEHLGTRNYDRVAMAGASKDLDAVLAHVDTALRLHQIRSAVLVHHEDCGAYGSEGTYERHCEHLRTARRENLARYPELQVRLYYLLLSGEMYIVEAE